MKKIFKSLFRNNNRIKQEAVLRNSLLNWLETSKYKNFSSLDYSILKNETLAFVKENQIDSELFLYKYANEKKNPCLYASFYACAILSLYGEIDTLSEPEKDSWKEYFDLHQSQSDGLFWDPVLDCDYFKTQDWWGARHLALHITTAYIALDRKPKYDLYFLEPLHEEGKALEWIESRDWDNANGQLEFVGNEVMNWCCLLQYSRDFMSNQQSGKSLKIIMDWLYDNICPKTGLWGKQTSQKQSPELYSQSVQNAYHIYPLFTYDNITLPANESIIDSVLKTQNELGGFGTRLNSSACEDIDSIEPLARFGLISDYRTKDIEQALKKALPWVLCNQNKDGGFVFRRDEAFWYGCEDMTTGANESSMFATWFRTLSLAYLLNFLHKKPLFNIIKAPGLHIPLTLTPLL